MSAHQPLSGKGLLHPSRVWFRFGVPELLSSFHNFCWILGQWNKTHWNPPFTWLSQMDHKSMTMGYPKQQNNPKILGLWIQRSSLNLWNFCSFVGLDIAERKMAPFRMKNGARLSQRLSYHKSNSSTSAFCCCWVLIPILPFGGQVMEKVMKIVNWAILDFKTNLKAK